MHWTNALAMAIMIPSGWGIYNDSVIFGFLHFPAEVRLGTWAAESLQWHFAGMWLLMFNGIAYFLYGFATGRFSERLLPIRSADVITTIRETLRLHLAHEDLTIYNAVQKILYIVVLLAGIMQVVTGFAIWKPVQLSGLVSLLGGFQSARLLHFIGMAIIVGFLFVHVAVGTACASNIMGHADGRSARDGRAEGEVKSFFRPARTPDAGILDNHRALLRDIDRRKFFRGGLSLGALTMLTGCDVSNDASVQKGLRAMSSFNDGVQSLIFGRERFAPTYPESMVLKPPRFNAYYSIDKVRLLDGTSWKLDVSGLVGDRSPWTLEQLAALPQRDMVIRHICVEGWDYIGQWSGVPLRTFLERVGADLKAHYVAFRTADDYKSSIDMATALHPQTLLATTYAKETLPPPFGYPLRLRTSTKLGFKNPKWITSIEVTNDYPGGFWEDQGFNWFAGI